MIITSTRNRDWIQVRESNVRNQEGDAEIAHLQRFAEWLDVAWRIPGTRVRFGMDSLIGLLPGVGDVTGALLSGYIVVKAAQRGASRWTLGRMIVNVLVDVAFGSIPFLGDLFDVAWKANRRNVRLLEKQLSDVRSLD